MGMSLNDIEAKADELAEALDGAGAALAKDLTTKLEGLAYAAQIKATVAHQRRTEESLLRPDWIPVSVPCTGCAKPTEPAASRTYTSCRCSWTSCQQMNESNTVLGPHHEGACPLWRLNADSEPTKPAADRLHELVSYFVVSSSTSFACVHATPDPIEKAEYLARSKAYDDAATKLQDILSEGGL